MTVAKKKAISKKKAVAKANAKKAPVKKSGLHVPRGCSISTPYWHIHHQQLFEYSDNIKQRISGIKTNKPRDERATRLRLLKPVRLDKAQKAALLAFNKAELAYQKCRVRNNDDNAYYTEKSKLRVARDEARRAFENTLGNLKDLHDKQCKDCPWNGFTIFPNKPNAGQTYL